MNIIDKIIKCLNMSESNVNEHEAANALHAAKKLAAKHNLDIAEIEAIKQDKDSSEITYDIVEGNTKTKRAYSIYEKQLFFVCDHLFGTKHYFSTRTCGHLRETHTAFIGTPTDVKLSLAVFTILRKMVERNARKTYGNKWTSIHRSYCLGFAYKLKDRAIMQVQEPSTSYALVVQNKEQQIKDFFDAMGLDQSRANDSADIDDEAFVQGAIKARKVNLNFKESLV